MDFIIGFISGGIVLGVVLIAVYRNNQKKIDTLVDKYEKDILALKAKLKI